MMFMCYDKVRHQCTRNMICFSQGIFSQCVLNFMLIYDMKNIKTELIHLYDISHTQVGLGEDIYDDDKANFGKSIKQLDPSAK